MTSPDYPVAQPGPAAPSTSVVVHCSEPRFTRAFDELLARIGSPDAEHISAPGGPWWVAEASRFTRNRMAKLAISRILPSRVSLSGLLADSGVRRVILVAHQECTWYARLHPALAPADAIRRQAEDLIRACEAVTGALGQRAVVSGHVLTFDDSGARFRTLF